ncbi:MAG: sulfotransferase domain-containing protein [Chloroflexi bacterium]|nr:sulfotransferase domain-containing protein [Chloroflexota bacterium]
MMQSAEGWVLPDFLIVGAMRGGTASLAHYLDEHPEVSVPEVELHFFDRDANWGQGPGYYSQFFSTAMGETRIGDRTPAYSHYPNRKPPIPERIASLLPNALLFWSLRNPVDRAYSHYWHSRTRGLERASFEQAVLREGQGQEGRRSTYLERGKYVQQIHSFLRLFPLSRMHFVLSERLFGDPGPVLRPIFRFLGVDDSFQGKRPGQVLNRPRKLIRPWGLHRLLWIGLRDHPRLRSRLQTALGSSRPDMPSAIREQLAEFYQPYNQELSSLIGLDLSPWESQ